MNANKMRKITQAIRRHAGKMQGKKREAFLEKALLLWDLSAKKNTEEQEETPTMKKSEQLSRWHRNRNFQDIAADVQNIPTPAPVTPQQGTFLKQALAAPRPKLTGHQIAALKHGLPEDYPGIEAMTGDDMQRAAEKMRIEVANQVRALRGLPPLEYQPEKQQSASYLSFL